PTIGAVTVFAAGVGVGVGLVGVGEPPYDDPPPQLHMATAAAKANVAPLSTRDCIGSSKKLKREHWPIEQLEYQQKVVCMQVLRFTAITARVTAYADSRSVSRLARLGDVGDRLLHQPEIGANRFFELRFRCVFL